MEGINISKQFVTFLGENDVDGLHTNSENDQFINRASKC